MSTCGIIDVIVVTLAPASGPKLAFPRPSSGVKTPVCSYISPSLLSVIAPPPYCQITFYKPYLNHPFERLRYADIRRTIYRVRERRASKTNTSGSQAIYPDCISRRANEEGILLKMELAIDLGGPRRVKIIDDRTNSASSSTPGLGQIPSSSPPAPFPSEISVSYLPPLILDLLLPSNYPLVAPPTILSAYFTHSWLSPKYLVILMTHIHHLWKEQRDLGEGVLWRIAESIVTAEFLNDPLHLICSDDSLLIPHAAPNIVRQQLSSYDTSINDASFAITTFRCAICFEDRKGSACISLACEHVFCKDCLRDGWGLAVKEGECSAVRCPDPECVAKTSHRARKELTSNDGEAGEEDVRRVLTEEEVTRWKWLRVQRDIARDPTIVHCPLQFCQSPVPAPNNGPADIGGQGGDIAISWQKLRTCESCGFSFCIFCKKAWHGPITPCATRSGSSFVKEYLDLPEDSSRRLLMERTLGKKNLTRMIKQYQEDEQNREWLESSTTRCPGCSVLCEKSHGCNHMNCVRCQVHYCFRCGDRVDPKDPYKHWSAKGNPCYGQLFDAEDMLEEPEAWEWAPLVL